MTQEEWIKYVECKLKKKFEMIINSIQIQSDNAVITTSQSATKRDLEDIKSHIKKLVDSENNPLDKDKFSLWLDNVYFVYSNRMQDDDFIEPRDKEGRRIYHQQTTVVEDTKKINELNAKLEETQKALEIEKQKEKETSDVIDPNVLISDLADEYKFAEKLKNNILELYHNEEDQLEPILKEGMKMKGKDRFGHQVFTREVDINKMIDSIGRETILNSETTILEPTSGDGAFTVRILSYRLEKILNETTEIRDFLQNSLRALSTIYSIEYDAQTCWIQRCNLYTVMIKYYNEFAEKEQLGNKTVNQDWDSLVHKILFDNVMWGAFAATNHEDYKSYETILGFDRSSDRPLCITKWVDIKVDKKLKIKYRKEIIS